MSIDWTPDLSKYGGVQVTVGETTVWDFGYRGPGFGSRQLQNQEIDWLDRLLEFVPSGQPLYGEEDRINYARLWHHEKVNKVLGRNFDCTKQYTGSCVGAGGGNLYFTLMCVEVILGNEHEEIVLPFWPFTYGRSRFRAGIRGRGDGSLESGWMEAAQEDGVFPATMEGLPKYEWSDGFSYGGGVEMDWSDGARIPEKWLEIGRKHLIKEARVIKTADQAWQALGEGWILGWAGMWGGLMQCPIKGNPPVLLNRRSGQWAHKEMSSGRWLHPELNRLFKIMNQWGLKTHGDDPQGDPGGGYWIEEKEMDWQCRTGEVIGYRAFNGIPSPDPIVIDWTPTPKRQSPPVIVRPGLALSRKKGKS